MGITQGFYANTNAVTEDNDGEIEDSYYNGVIDLTHVLSLQLGKQLSQMATYRVSFVQIDLRNVNNAVDNDASLCVGGHLQWYSPTKHRIDALQAMRDVHRMDMKENDYASAGSPGFPFALSSDKKYSGLRFDFHGDSDIEDATDNKYTGIFGGAGYHLDEILFHYNAAMGGTPSEEGYDTSGQGQALWQERTASGEDGRDSVYWVTSYQNRIMDMQGLGFTPTTDEDDSEFHSPVSRPWTLDLGNRYAPVLGGLLHLDLTHTNTDTAGILEDEYFIQVTVGVEGWEEF